MKIAIVTGASSGIGRSTARKLAAREVGVIVTYNTNAAAAAALVDDIQRVDGSAEALHLDVSNVAGHQSFAAQVRALLLKRWSRKDFDFLVNNAGVGGGFPFDQITEEQFDKLLATNFKGPYFLTQKLLPLIAEGGHIINVSSATAHHASVGYSAYGSMKAAVTMVTRYWAKEFAPRKIRVNTVTPGPVLTNFMDGAFAKNPEHIGPIGATTLIGRIAQPDDVGAVIAALLSDDCNYMTASDIDVTGGFMV